MTFEVSDKPSDSTPDRKLGDEWRDWDGKLQSNDTQVAAGVFLGLAGAATILLAAGWIFLVWLINPRLEGFGWPGIGRGLAWLGCGYLALWDLALLLAGLGSRIGGRLVRILGGVQWILGLCIGLGRLVGLSRDKVGHAFLLIYNRLEFAPPKVSNPLRLLMLLPRCLSRESLQALRTLKEQLGFSQIVVAGGTEARRAIAQTRPEGIIAVACERDLLLGIKDIHGRIPLLSFSNQRPEGPCRNTQVDLEAIHRAVKMFLGQTA